LQIFQQQQALQLGGVQHSPGAAAAAGVMSLSAQQLLSVAEDVAAREADKWAARLADMQQVC
jgi:hypothetical protein